MATERLMFPHQKSVNEEYIYASYFVISAVLGSNAVPIQESEECWISAILILLGVGSSWLLSKCHLQLVWKALKEGS